jgi:uncharacterized surface protein with fasciclin (FAS1) repeats
LKINKRPLIASHLTTKPFFNLKIIDMKKFNIHVLLIALLLSVASLNCGTSSNLLKTGSSLMSSLGGIPNLSQFTSLLQTPGLSKALGNVMKKPFTLLAPTNDALSGMGADAMSKLTNPSNISSLANMIKGQIVPGKLDAAGVAQSGLKTAAGNALNLNGANLGDVVTGDKFNIIPVNKVLGQ